MTEGDTAVHAASALSLELGLITVDVDLVEVLDALLRLVVPSRAALVLNEAPALLGSSNDNRARAAHVFEIAHLRLGIGRRVDADHLLLVRSEVLRHIGAGLLLRGSLGLCALEVGGIHLEELALARRPISKNLLRHLRACDCKVLLDELLHLALKLGAQRAVLLLGVLLHRAPLLLLPGGVPEVRAPARHASSKVDADLAKHDDTPASHVLAAVVAAALNHRIRARVADSKALSSDATSEKLAASRAVEAHIADDDVVLGDERRDLGGVHGHNTSAQALAAVVVCVAFEVELHASGEEAAERLSRGAGALDLDGAVGQWVRAEGGSVLANSLGKLVREDRAHGTVEIRHRGLDLHLGLGAAQVLHCLRERRHRLL
mmetsp:Transcript_5397/g.10847  ORF Transcript_5397/g.10847 Transcript_5397/m.10847 type:complete len:376 (+) Transcript_5397:1676-2803(+)